MKRAIFLIVPLFVFLPFISRASACWLEVKGNGKVNKAVRIQVCYGYIDEFSVRHRDTGTELTLIGDFKISILDEKGSSTNIPIHQQGDCWEGTFTPAENGSYRILGINEVHPVVDRSRTGGKNIRPIDYLCATYQVGENAQITPKPIQFLDIVAAFKNKMLIVKAFNNGVPAESGTTLRVFNPENWEKELTVNNSGEAAFMPTQKGLYIIREDWVDPAPGNYKGVAYTSIRYRCNYCLCVK